MDDVRKDLVTIQRRLVDEARIRLEATAGSERAELRRYHEALHRATAGFERLSTRQELVEAAVDSRVVFVGDFHTLRQAQRMPLRLCAHLQSCPQILRGNRRLALGLEMVMARDQRHLDRYLAGELDERGFLRATRYQSTWSFPWLSYRPLLDFARQHRLPVLALNSRPERTADRLRQRDIVAAGRLADFVQDHPETLVVVLFGDLHLVDEHLPARFREACGARGMVASYTVAFQNIGGLYWRLAEAGLEQFAEVIRLADQDAPWARARFCIMNATPLARIQSHLYWEERGGADVLERWGFSGEPDFDANATVADQVVDLVRVIGEFLRLPEPDLDRLTVRTLPTLPQARSRDAATESDTRILQPRSVLGDKAGTVFLAAASIERAGEAAAHFLHESNSGAGAPGARPPRDRFFVAVLRHSLGYFGSKIANHLRTAYLPADYQRAAALARAARRRTARVRGVGRLAGMVLKCLKVLECSPGIPPKALPRMSAREATTAAQALGYILGERIFSAVVQGFVARDELRELFRAPLEPTGEAERLVRAWQHRLRNVTDFYTSREDRL